MKMYDEKPFSLLNGGEAMSARMVEYNSNFNNGHVSDEH